MTGRTFCWLVLQEARQLLAARWVGGATILLCAYSAFSVALSMGDLQEHAVSYQELLQQRLEVQLRGTGRALGRGPEPGLRVIRPPAAGAVVAAGIEPTLPAAWEFTPAGTEALAPYVRREVGISGSGVGDLAGIIAGLGGLLAMWLGVSAMVSDRAAGRIAALRTLPVTSGAMAVLRLAGGTLALTVVAAAWCLTAGVSLRVFAPAEVTIPSAIPAWMAGPVLCYLALMFGLGTGVGALAREGLSALVTAFAVWIAIVFVFPQADQLIIRSLIAVPPQTRMEIERREQMADAARLLEYEIGDAMATRWPNVPSPTDEHQRTAFVAVGEQTWRSGWARIREAVTIGERRWLEERARADRVKRWLDSLNPGSWLVETMAELAGTGPSAETGWMRAIAARDQTLNEHLFENRPRVSARLNRNGEELLMAFDRRPAPRFSDLPPFVPPPAHPGVWTTAAIGNFAGLAAYAAIVMAAAYVRLRARSR